ncbi:hypothetical protein RhiirA4_477869 [Rhizophagus irregularis]|uniref:BTB domain-containing protein n=1 Tax=Rhizophagus irregularis TaxID=588596 RepID=A0A2I1HDU8_9GLOM|nr:hypothetical protein RhiirA4_477869 [Rhizophagus irregularis]
MAFEYSQETINDYEKLLEADEEYDVIIYAEFSKKWPEKKDGKFIFNKPNIPPKLFIIFLRFIYCGKIDLTNLLGFEVLKLLMAVDELNIQSLILCIQEYLIKHHRELFQQNSIEILKTIYQHESFTELWNFYLDRICEEPLMLFNSDKFINLNTPLLELLLNRDDLNLDEIIVWNNLIKWCLAQHSNVPQGRRFSVSGYARIGISYAKILSVINNENIYKLKFIPHTSRTDEDLATARLYFKRPGRIRRLFLDNWTRRTSGLEFSLKILRYGNKFVGSDFRLLDLMSF